MAITKMNPKMNFRIIDLLALMLSSFPRLYGTGKHTRDDREEIILTNTLKFWVKRD